MADGTDKLLATIERFEAAEARISELVREANSSAKNLRDACREADLTALRLRETATVATGETFLPALEAEVARQLERLGEATSIAMDNSVAKVEREFDKLRDILMGEGKHGGHGSIPDLIKARTR